MEIFKDKKFDFAIYGGSVKGILTACILAKKNYKILLINKYGFLGGAISENLNILQNLNSIEFNKSLLNFDSLFYNSNNLSQKFINPEQLKFELQDLLLNYAIEPLFHVTPISATQNEINLVGKEGILTVKANKVIDCSDNLYLDFLNKNVSYSKGFYFITIKGEISDKSLKDIINPLFIYQISNKRYFVGFEIEFNDINNVEINAHDLISRITKDLIKLDARIELLPISTYLQPKLIKDNLEFDILNNLNIPDYNNILINALNYEHMINENL